MKYYLNIQSVSDIITNSSSETFCRICSKDQIEEIYEVLKSIIPSDDYECEPVVSLDKLDERELEYEPEELLKEISPEDKYVRLELPYRVWCPAFFKSGIEGLLKEKFPNSTYTIIYNE